jgi:thioredoxin reductase (NADPH)
MHTTVPILIGLAAVVFLCMGAVLDDRRARVRRREQREEPARALPLLHSINDDRCIGCEACIDVCPTEVLDLVDHKVRVARFSDCVQCEQCANACPTQALVMYREGTTPRMLTVPELDEHFQTGVPGQYLIGEVAGKPLVKNAANLGRAVIEHIVRDLAQRPLAADVGGVADIMDVVIVGSGPGGLSAGLACLKHKLSCLVLEKEHIISSTVSRYPKGKHFMAEPCSSQNVSFLPVFDGSKEDLVAAWQQVVAAVALPIKLGEAVETVKRGDDGVFTIKTTVGTYRARTVVLATGLRGKPRLLVAPGANLEKVQSLLDDPAEFAGEAVLVVGGGDSAVEGAMALADVGATVTLSYRGDGFKRCKQGNQKRLAEMTAAKQLTVLLESNVTCFTPDSVTIKLADKSETTIANQRAFVLIGADTPVAWLETNHVRFVERPHLYALGSTEEVVRRLAPDATECPRTPAEAIAIVLDRPVPRSPGRQVQSVVELLYHELRDVVTSVSAAFRLSELEPPRETRQAMTQTPLRGVGALRASSQVIPASRLIARRPATQAAPGGGIAGSDPTMVGVAPVAPLAPLRPSSARAGTTSGQGTQRDLAALRSEVTTAQIPSLRVRTDKPASRTARDPRRRATTALPRVPDPTTVEVRSLPALEQEALQLAALRCMDGGATMEIDALPEREQRALRHATESCASDGVVVELHPVAERKRTLSTATVRRDATGSQVIPARLQLEHPIASELPAHHPLDLATEVDMPSLRALERSTQSDAPSLTPLDPPTELDLPSLRSLERATEVATPSLRAPALERVALAAGSSPHALGQVIEAARPHAVPAASAIASRRMTTSSVLTSAPRPSPPSPRPSAIPPPVPQRAMRPSAVPPPVPPRPPRLPRGSAAIPKRPPTPPQLAAVSFFDDDTATIVHGESLRR